MEKHKMAAQSVTEVDSLLKALAELRAENNKLRQALEFYADKKNWYPGDSFKQSCRIDENDLEYFPQGKTSDLIGGRLARSYFAVHLLSQDQELTENQYR